jgi:hypothetical protein
MVGNLARGAFLLILALMIVAYVFSAANTKAPEPAGDQVVVTFYC